MSDLFAPKEIIPPGYQQLEILSVGNTEQYGPQVAFKTPLVMRTPARSSKAGKLGAPTRLVWVPTSTRR